MNLGRLAHTNQTKKATLHELDKFMQYRAGWVANHSAIKSLREKLGGNPARAHFIVYMSDWLLDLSSVFRHHSPKKLFLLQQQLPLIFEVVISIQYLHNQILDGKAGVTDRSAVRANLLAANLLKDQLYAYIESEIPRKWRHLVERAVRQIFQLVDLGQQYEQTYNTFQAWQQGQYPVSTATRDVIDLSPIAPFLQKIKKDLASPWHSAVDTYFERVYLTCAALFVEGTQLIGQILNLKPKSFAPALHFSAVYGVMRQLVNDNADWVPSNFGLDTHDKVVFDSYSDLRNGVLTLPLIFYLSQHKQGHIDQLLSQREDWSVSLESAVFGEITASYALFQSIQNTRVLGELAASYLSPSILGCAGLMKSCEIVHWNKYLVPCLRHTKYKEYRKTSYSKRNKYLIKQLRASRQIKEQSIDSSLVTALPTWWSSLAMRNNRQVRIAERLIAQF